MQGSPQLLTVKQVATALGIDERSVRDKLQLGALKGTKKTVGQRDQWFVHQRDLDAELARRGQSPINHSSQVAGQPPSTSEMNLPPVTPTPFYQPNQAPRQGYAVPPQQPAMPYQHAFPQAPQTPEVPPVMNFAAPPAPATQAPVTPSAQEPTRAGTTTVEVDYTDDVTDATVLEAIADDSVFENEGAEVPTSGGEPRTWRNGDLENAVTATAEKIMKPLMDRVEELTRAIVLKDLEIEEKDRQLKLLPDFEAQKKKLLAEIEAERKGAEIQFAKVQEKEEEARALEAENALLKQKADEAVLSAAKLADLEKVVAELQKPKQSWLQKLFAPGSLKAD